MKAKLGIFAIAVAFLVLSAIAWSGQLDSLADKSIDNGLKRSLIAFGTARAVNAALSVAESAQVSAGIGVGATLTIGQVVNPLNTLIEQFAQVMFWSTVAFGTMKLLMTITGTTAVSTFLTLALLAWFVTMLRGQQKSWLSKVAIAIVVLRFAIPTVMLGSEFVFDHYLKKTHDQAQAEVTKPLPTPELSNLRKGIDDLKQGAESAVMATLTLTAVFLLQTVIVPALLFWLLLRGTQLLLLQRVDSGL